MRYALRSTTVLVLVAEIARAQVIPGELAVPGNTLATTTDADAARVNVGAVSLARVTSLRGTFFHDFRDRSAIPDGGALTVTAPLLFGLAGSLGVAYLRPQTPSARGHIVTGEMGLSLAVARQLGVGSRVRITGAAGQGADLTEIDGRTALDLGLAWRPFPGLSFGVTGVNVLGPRVPAMGLDRAVAAGVGIRPTGTDDLTFGLDGSVAQGGTGWVRAGARVRIPFLGYLRAEGAMDFPSREWRAAAGIDVVWGVTSVGSGVFVGGRGESLEGPLGGYATVRIESERDRGVPDPALVVSIPVYGDLRGREVSQMVLQIERLRRDAAVRAVVFAPRDDLGGMANAEEIREALGRLRASNKRVVCHLTDPSAATYYACTSAESIAMDPAGVLRFAGIRSGRYFLGEALQRIGVRTEFVRIGVWKSAPEQFTRRDATPEARAQEEQLLDDVYASFVTAVAGSRGVSDAQARQLIESGPYGARRALNVGLVDTIGTRETIERNLERLVGAAVIPIDRYVSLRPRRWSPGRTVAVVHFQGEIIEGENFDLPGLGVHLLGDRSMVELIDQVAQNPRVGAIVLRMDSSGGDALASEVIWRAVARAARRKPVIASMGRVAASGGYYIAAPAAEIFANPSTLTGSIGIFYGKADVAGLLERLGVGVELYRRGPRADMDSMLRPFTDDERQVLTELVRETYQLFLARVAEGRHSTLEAIDRVGQGQVFAGVRAVRVGLVDHVGGLLAAIDRARALAGLDDVDMDDVIELPAPATGLLQRLVRGLDASAEAPQSFAVRFLEQTEVPQALGWLVAMGWAGRGRMMALTEQPLGIP